MPDNQNHLPATPSRVNLGQNCEEALSIAKFLTVALSSGVASGIIGAGVIAASMNRSMEFVPQIPISTSSFAFAFVCSNMVSDKIREDLPNSNNKYCTNASVVASGLGTAIIAILPFIPMLVISGENLKDSFNIELNIGLAAGIIGGVLAMKKSNIYYALHDISDTNSISTTETSLSNGSIEL